MTNFVSKEDFIKLFEFVVDIYALGVPVEGKREGALDRLFAFRESISSPPKNDSAPKEEPLEMTDPADAYWLLSRAKKIIDGIGCVESAEEVRQAKKWLKDYEDFLGGENEEPTNDHAPNCS